MSLQAMNKTSWAQRRLNSKLLSDQCGLTKRIFDRKQEDTHICPFYKAQKEDRNHLFTYQDLAAKKNFKKYLKELEKNGRIGDVTKDNGSGHWKFKVC